MSNIIIVVNVFQSNGSIVRTNINTIIHVFYVL